jgi:hypothetical protein
MAIGAVGKDTPTSSSRPNATPAANSANRPAVQCAPRPNRTDSNMPSIKATACPPAVKSPLETATTNATVNHPPTHAGRQRVGIAAVNVPRTATAP